MTTQVTLYPEAIVSVASNLYDERASRPMCAPRTGLKPNHIVEKGKAQVTAPENGLESGILDDPLQTMILAAAVAAAIGLVGRRNPPNTRGVLATPASDRLFDITQQEGLPCSTQSPS